MMLRSQANRLLAVRRVTQINKGRRTPGVDKRVYETPQEKLELARELITLKINEWDPPPVQRVYIPKGKIKYRPLGIPTQLDRCFQTIVKNALEPFWEARFEHYSFGFRPGRNTMDAVDAIFRFTMKGSRPWILDADIKGAYDHIEHDALMKAIGNSPTRFIIRKWLEAGVMEGLNLSPTLTGIPQGGPVSPLLANITLHGMEAAIKMKRLVRPSGHTSWPGETVLIRYADDFVALSKSETGCQKAQAQLEEWLAQRGLVMSEAKTAIRHIDEGFDFLGFNIRQYDRQATKKRGKQVIIRPSKANLQKIRDEFKTILHRKPIGYLRPLIFQANAKIRGWAGYYRHTSHWKDFQKLDEVLWYRSWRYVKRNHPTKGAKWLKKKYFDQDWRLTDGEVRLLRFGEFHFVKRPHLRYGTSPDNPDEEAYWNERRSIPSTMLRGKARLWRQQKGLCLYCKSDLDTGEEIVIDHVIPKSEGGHPYSLSNQALIHETCHHRKHHQRVA